MWELLIGSILYSFESARKFEPAESSREIFSSSGMLLILLSVVFIDERTIFSGVWALAPTMGTGLIIYGGESCHINRFISNRIFVFLGLVSFPLYLWHWPLLYFLPEYRVADLALAGVLAFITNITVERPFQRYLSIRNNIYSSLQKKIIVSGILGLLFLFTLGKGIGRSFIPNFYELRFPEARGLLNYSHYDISYTRLGSCFMDTSQAFRDFDRFCFEPKSNASRKVLLIGDSMAAHLYEGMNEVSKKSSSEIFQMTASACAPVFNQTDASSVGCRRSMASIESKVGQANFDSVVIFAQWTTHLKIAEFRTLFLKTIAKLRERNKTLKIVLLGAAPVWNDLLPNVVEKSFIRKSKLVPTESFIGLDGEQFKTDMILSEIAKEANIEFISLFKLLCTKNECKIKVGDHLGADLISYDETHFTLMGSRFVARKIFNNIRDL